MQLQALILLFVNRVAHIHTYRVYMMVGRVVSLNCPIGTQQLKYLQQKLMLICKRSLHKQATNRQQNEQNLWGITLCGLQSVNQLTVYSWMSHFTLFGEGLWWALLPNFIQYTPGMQIMSLHTGKFLVARLSHMQTKIQRSKQRKAGWGPGNEATQEGVWKFWLHCLDHRHALTHSKRLMRGSNEIMKEFVHYESSWIEKLVYFERIHN